MAASYPGAIPTTPTRDDADMSATTSHKTNHDRLWEEVRALCQTVGLSPVLSLTTLASRATTVNSFTPSLGATSAPNIGSTGTAVGRYVRSGRLITVEFFFEFGGTGITQGSGTYFVAPPINIDSPIGANATLAGRVVVSDSGVGIREFTPIRASATAIAWRAINPSSYGDGTSITSSTIGLTFAAGDRVSGIVQYFSV